MDQKHHRPLDPHGVGERQENAIGDLGEGKHRDHRLGDLPDGHAVGRAIPVEESVDEGLHAISDRIEQQDRHEQEGNLKPSQVDVQTGTRGVSAKVMRKAKTPVIASVAAP